MSNSQNAMRQGNTEWNKIFLSEYEHKQNARPFALSVMLTLILGTKADIYFINGFVM